MVTLFLKQVLFLVSLMFIVVLYFWIKREYGIGKKEISDIKQSYIESKKESVKKETNRATDYIEFKIEQSGKALKNKIKKRTELAHKIALGIYNENKGHKSTLEIKELIVDALKSIRFDDGRGYYFIGDLKGNLILLPAHPRRQGKNLYNFQDKMGNYIIRDAIKIANTQKEGFISNYWIRNKSDSSLGSKKLSYIKLIGPLDWYVGTGDFYDDFNANIQSEVLNWLSNYRFGDEGYIFVNTYEGDALLMDGHLVEEKTNIWEIEDPNGIKVVQEERRAVKNPKGDFIYYSWKKLNSSEIGKKTSFIKGIPEWNWMVGSGVYIDEINEVVAAKESEIRKAMLKDILFIIIWLSILFILIYIFALYQSKKTQKNIDSFVHFFKFASTENILIDESNISFSEFKSIAASANKMISEIKKSQKRNQEEEAHYENLFERSPEAIVFIKADGQIKKANQAFTKLFGFKNSEIYNKNLDDLIVPSELKKEAILINKNFKDGSGNQIEAIRITKDQQKVYVSIIGSPVRINEELLGYYVIYRNINQQKDFEHQLYTAKLRAEESDRLKTSFLTNLSHEIRTPLNAIIGFSTLLNTKEYSRESQKEYLRLLGNSGKLLLEIIDNIIDISKIESSTLVINKTKCNLNTLLDELLIDYMEFKQNMNLNDVQLSLHKDIKDQELFVLSDIKRVRQIYSNLLDNALKFTEKGKVEFGYRVKNDRLICYVEDTGIGIDKKEQEYIFDRFRQADESTTRKYGGTGIGLALCKRLAELLGGKLWVESEKGIGSRFYFSIPYDKMNHTNTTQPVKQMINQIDWSSKNILIAEDVEANYKLLHSFLERSNAKIFWAQDGHQVLKMIDQDPEFDLILMDINMPIMNGHEALKNIREQGYKTPVVAQTAYATDEQRHEIEDLGYDDYILKPITLQSLYQKISRFLD